MKKPRSIADCKDLGEMETHFPGALEVAERFAGSIPDCPQGEDLDRLIAHNIERIKKWEAHMDADAQNNP